MASIAQSFGLLASQNQFLAYFIIYVATIFLGNISGFSSLWLAMDGVLGNRGVFFTILTLITADVTGDLLWYSLGRTLRETRFGPWVIAHVPYHDRIEAHLHKNARRWIFLSKFIYASTFPIIFCAGWVNIEFRKFFRTSLLAVLLWTPILTAITYGLFSGLAPLSAQHFFHRFEYLIAIGILAFLLIDAALSKIVEMVFEDREEST